MTRIRNLITAITLLGGLSLYGAYAMSAAEESIDNTQQQATQQEAIVTISGRVLAGGSPLSGITVTLQSSELTLTSVSNEDGKFSFEINQPNLVYTMSVDDPNHKFYSKEISPAGENVEQDIELQNFGTSREFPLSVKVSDNVGCEYAGVTVKLRSNLYSLNYSESETRLNANGELNIKVYGGSHTLTVSMPGMKTETVTFNVNKATTLDVALSEDVKLPFGLRTELDHDIWTGENNIHVEWNQEEAVFEDDFESYNAFTIDPQPWTGIDGDHQAPAIFTGTYANSGVPNYGQIINPLAVNPAWDLNDYYTLRPRSGKQYLGFIVLADDTKTLDDWMITPLIHVGEDNIVRFYAKGSDATNAKFTVGITEKENPTANDFKIISDGNVISCDYMDWTEVNISLAEYEGKDVKIGIHCFSGTGSFISMIDDFFVGRVIKAATAKSRRVAPKSIENPNEKFEIYLDDQKVGETEDYNFTISNVAFGDHKISVRATYLESASDFATSDLSINESDFSKVNFVVTSNNGIIPESVNVSLSGTSDYNFDVTSGSRTVNYLPNGRYVMKVTADNYDSYTTTISVDRDKSVNISLNETLVTPYNITAEISEIRGSFDITLKWNQDLGFKDSFESYRDFSTGTFGGWTTLNFDQTNSYPIGLGSQDNIVYFPGASTVASPASVPPMVFNPNSTTPSMSSDPAIQAYDGEKSIIFMGPQMATANKWLISPNLTIGQDYEWKIIAKAYSIYPETLQFLISTKSDDPDDFVLLDEVSPGYSSWTQYILSLEEYSGEDVYLAIRCTSTDGFIVQVDMVEVGPIDGREFDSVGNILNYDITIDNALVAQPTTSEYTIMNLAPGNYMVNIYANYISGKSQPGRYDLTLKESSIEEVNSGAASILGLKGMININTEVAEQVNIFKASGEKIYSGKVVGNKNLMLPSGVYIVRIGTKTYKTIVR